MANEWYQIHDNGNIPFLAKVNPTERTLMVVGGDSLDSSNENYEYTETVVKDTEYMKIWLGADEYGAYKGNTIVAQLTHDTYMFVGEEIYTFSLEPGETIEMYESPMRGFGIPMPYAVTTNKVLLFIGGYYIPRDTLTKYADPYHSLRDLPANHLYDFPRTKNKQLICARRPML
jgi:hypothetical protein